ncbi:MAG: pyoverdine biosynthesis protein PvcA [Gammaproteobacteria bacterium RIFCSPHIGHO2_12_FULL_43_28]|nr:MAG: pyoverdine biosynthesis protein PvcA [Gammaproteobacteria bacterium RIFCSPHIGHO2_12_FULL_43_28]
MALTKFLFRPTEIKCEIPLLLETASHLARKIMLNVMQFRRIAGPKKSCATSACKACLEPHLRQVISAIKAQQPITFVLPAFPAKSPNLAKVLGTLPDMAERLALEFLNNLCQQIQKIYSPGARVILCSDGRVFNDVVGIRDIDVTDYQRELSLLIKKMSLTSISMFNLDDVYSGMEFNRMRNQLMAQYGESLEVLKDAVRKGSQTPCSIENEEVHRQYCGMTRFLVEDAIRPGQFPSRNAIQKECRQRAYLVIQRSRAWSELIAKHFPHAVRLSIHPQTCGTSKLGIRLMEADSWMSPWHGVAMEVDGSFLLLKRAQAEALGARLVCREGRPSHYELKDKQKFSKLHGVLYGA